MENDSIKLLHISDLHIESDEEKYKFHKGLLEYLTNNIKPKKIDYLIISGDLGNRCAYKDNINKAETWIEELKDKLGLDNSQILLCPGNHDIDTDEISDEHYEKCLKYKRGYNYIKKDYPPKAFEKYKKLQKSFSFDSEKGKIKTILPNGDVFYETDKARFLIMNSSWLSQITTAKKDSIISSLKSSYTTNPDLYKAVKTNFGNVLCIDNKSDHYTDVGKQVYKHSFNHSENIRQQISPEMYNFLKERKFEDDGKINILIFHHPEFCLHYLEHFNFDDIEKSGTYYNVSKFSDLLICGHIHPNTTVKATDNYFKLPHLVGGACHLSGVSTKPLFYYYEISTKVNNEVERIFDCMRSVYLLNATSTENNIIERQELIPIHVDKQKANKVLKFKSDSIQKEEDFVKLNAGFQKIFSELLVHYFKVDNNIQIKHSVQDIWYPNKLKKHDYLINSTIHKFIIDQDSCILIDIFLSDILVFPELLNCRIEKYKHLNKFNEDEKIIEENIKPENFIYLPIIVDVFYSLLDSEDAKKDYWDRSNNIITDSFKKTAQVYEKLAVFLQKPNLSEKITKKLPPALNINKGIYIGSKFIDAIFKNEDISSDDLIINNDRFILELK